VKLFNVHVVEIVENFTEHNGEVFETYQRVQLNLNLCSEKMFLKPVLEHEVEEVIILTGNFRQVLMKYQILL
jgi:hypothetical protein